METTSPCTAACETAALRDYSLIVPSVAAGRACVGATDCQPGDDLCPVPTTTTRDPAAADTGNTVLNGDGSINADKALEFLAGLEADAGITVTYEGVDYAVTEVIESEIGAALFEMQVRKCVQVCASVCKCVHVMCARTRARVCVCVCVSRARTHTSILAW